jgi:DNA-binding transcriptional regulator YiaG
MNHTEFRALRKTTGLSMIKASKLFNTPYETWKSWENGKRPVKGVAIKALQLYIINKYLSETVSNLKEVYLG